MDEDTKVRIRRYYNNIEVSGKSVMFFGVWSIFKAIIYFFRDPQIYGEIREEAAKIPEDERIFFTVFVIILFFSVLLILFLFYFYIGRSAVRYARNEKNGKAFLVCAVILFVATLASIPSYFISLYRLEDIDTSIYSGMIDAATCVMLFDMVYSAFMIKMIKIKHDKKQ